MTVASISPYFLMSTKSVYNEMEKMRKPLIDYNFVKVVLTIYLSTMAFVYGNS